jgi:hypothetical protein
MRSWSAHTGLSSAVSVWTSGSVWVGMETSQGCLGWGGITPLWTERARAVFRICSVGQSDIANYDQLQ